MGLGVPDSFPFSLPGVRPDGPHLGFTSRSVERNTGLGPSRVGNEATGGTILRLPERYASAQREANTRLLTAIPERSQLRTLVVFVLDRDA